VLTRRRQAPCCEGVSLSVGDYAHVVWSGNWALPMGGLADLFGFRGRDSGGRNVGPREGREKMNGAIGTSNSWKTAATMLVAVLVLLVIALVSMMQPAPTADSASTPAVHPGVHPVVHPGVHPKRPGGSGFAEGSYVERHAELVAGHE
jgi:hypothetical protein